MEKITIVTCSRNKKEEKKDFLEHLEYTCGIDNEIIFIENSEGKSLTSIYSEMIEKCDTEIILFIHDDIDFLSPNWGKEIYHLFDENKDYGIIGVAGSGEFDSNCAWWNYKDKYGQVLHRKDGKSWLTTFSDRLKEDLVEVCVIDGLFMAVHKNRITQNFDTDFQGFNHYDTSFCIDNYLDGECKIGVTTNIRVAHNSIGETKIEWFVNKNLLNEKYSEYFPIKIKRKKN